MRLWNMHGLYLKVINGQSVETDDHGHAEVMVKSGQKLDVYHWLHGHSVAECKEAPGELEIHLPDKISDELLTCLSEHHIPYLVDSSVVYINENIDKYHIKRGDMAESCDHKGLVYVREGRRKVGSW